MFKLFDKNSALIITKHFFSFSSLMTTSVVSANNTSPSSQEEIGYVPFDCRKKASFENQAINLTKFLSKNHKKLFSLRRDKNREGFFIN